MYFLHIFCLKQKTAYEVRISDWSSDVCSSDLLAAWDWAYYAEKLRKAKYDFDESQTKPYFELDSVLQNGLFYEAHELYGLSFKERKDLPVYQPDVRVFEVFNKDGSRLGLFLADYYKRDAKQGGAWMNERSEERRVGKEGVRRGR